MRCGNFLVKEFVGDDAHELNLGMIVEIVLELVDYVVFDIAILDNWSSMFVMCGLNRLN